MKTITVLATLSLLIMGFATLVIGGFALSFRLLSGGELHGLLVVFFAAGTVVLWSFLLWIAVACKILLWSDGENGETDEFDE